MKLMVYFQFTSCKHVIILRIKEYETIVCHKMVEVEIQPCDVVYEYVMHVLGVQTLQLMCLLNNKVCSSV